MWDALESKKTGVLVHCTNGTSRSSAFVIAYLMYERRMTFANAMAFVKLKRNEARPNFGFAH
jgi:dual specificity phosphatase 12